MSAHLKHEEDEDSVLDTPQERTFDGGHPGGATIFMTGKELENRQQGTGIGRSIPPLSQDAIDSAAAFWQRSSMATGPTDDQTLEAAQHEPGARPAGATPLSEPSPKPTLHLRTANLEDLRNLMQGVFEYASPGPDGPFKGYGVEVLRKKLASEDGVETRAMVLRWSLYRPDAWWGPVIRLALFTMLRSSARTQRTSKDLRDVIDTEVQWLWSHWVESDSYLEGCAHAFAEGRVVPPDPQLADRLPFLPIAPFRMKCFVVMIAMALSEASMANPALESLWIEHAQNEMPSGRWPGCMATEAGGDSVTSEEDQVAERIRRLLQ